MSHRHLLSLGQRRTLIDEHTFDTSPGARARSESPLIPRRRRPRPASSSPSGDRRRRTTLAGLSRTGVGGAPSRAPVRAELVLVQGAGGEHEPVLVDGPVARLGTVGERMRFYLLTKRLLTVMRSSLEAPASAVTVMPSCT